MITAIRLVWGEGSLGRAVGRGQHEGVFLCPLWDDFQKQRTRLAEGASSIARREKTGSGVEDVGGIKLSA